MMYAPRRLCSSQQALVRTLLLMIECYFPFSFFLAVRGVTGKYFDLRQQVEDKLVEDAAAVNALAALVHRLMGLPEAPILP